MEFEPAVAPGAQATSTTWCFAFAEGQLLMPEGQDALAPGQLLDAEVRHYLGRLGGIDAWALRVRTAPSGCALCPCAPP